MYIKFCSPLASYFFFLYYPNTKKMNDKTSSKQGNIITGCSPTLSTKLFLYSFIIPDLELLICCVTVFGFVLQETELDKIIEEHLVNDAVSSHSEDVHHSSSDSEGSVHDTVTSVLYIPHGGTQQPESSPQSPVPSPRPVLTSQQSIVSGRFTRTSYASGETGHVSTPSRLSPLPISMISPETLEDKDENQDAPLVRSYCLFIWLESVNWVVQIKWSSCVVYMPFHSVTRICST